MQPTYLERQLERLERARDKRDADLHDRDADRDLIRSLWKSPNFQKLLESWDARHDPARLLAIDPSQSGWEAQFIGLRASLTEYWAIRKLWLRWATEEPKEITS